MLAIPTKPNSVASAELGLRFQGAIIVPEAKTIWKPNGCAPAQGVESSLPSLGLNSLRQPQLEFSQDSGRQGLQVPHILRSESFPISLTEQPVSRERTPRQRVDCRIPDNNMEAVFPHSQEPAHVNRIRRMPNKSCALSVDINLRRFSNRSFPICLHAELRQRVRFLNRRARSEIKFPFDSGTQVLGRKIESSQIAHLT